MMVDRLALHKALVERAKWFASWPYRRMLLSLRSIDEGEFWAEQLSRFKSIYADAIAHVPYYRSRPEIYTREPLEASHVLEALAVLPILEKSVVKENVEHFYRVPRKLLTAGHTTGGTTGTPLKIRSSLMERGFTNAILEDRNLDLTGHRYPRTVRLNGFLRGGRDSGDVFRAVLGTPFAYLSIYDLDEWHRDLIRHHLESFQPQVFHGYASALHQLALLFADDAPLELANRPVVVSTSETLFDHQRVDIENHLDALVVNEYGSQEGQHLVLECTHHQLHIHPARGVVELLMPETQAPATSGERGDVVVTGLMNHSMPLIRYRIGDSALSTGYAVGCDCGLAWPTIGAIEGRTEDLVRTKDGRRIGMLGYSVIKDLKGIRESQIVQRSFDAFEFRIVLENEADKLIIEEHISEQMYARVSPDAVIEFHYMDRVPRTESGKVRAVVVAFDGNSD